MTNTTAITNWDEELAKQAKVATELVANDAGGTFVSTRAGILSIDGATRPGNQTPVIVLAALHENTWYKEKYSDDGSNGPSCFAFGDGGDDMCPHELSAEPQAESCALCPLSKFGSAIKDVVKGEVIHGKGKACGNRLRIAFIEAGSIDKMGNAKLEDSEDYFKSAQIYYIRVPVTSVREYASFVKRLASLQSRPPFGVYSILHIDPDVRSQFKIKWDYSANVSNELMPVIMDRVKEAKDAIAFPYKSAGQLEGEKEDAQSDKF